MRDRSACIAVHGIAFCCLLGLGAPFRSVEAQAPSPRPGAPSRATAPTIDSALVGVWGVDARGGYEFRADGTFILEGSVRYSYDAAGGVWHYWQPGMEAAKVTADYQVSADRKSLQINLKHGRPLAHLTKIR